MNQLHSFFIPESIQANAKQLRSAKVLVNASLLTSIFSMSYLFISLMIGFNEGVWLMGFNILIFILLPFLLKIRLGLKMVGHIYTTGGIAAVVILVYFSGGFISPILPWLVAGPTMALLIGTRQSAYFWAVLMLIAIIYFGWLQIEGVQLPVNYDAEWHNFFSILVYTGLLLILFIINLVFERNRSDALVLLEKRNAELKETLAQLEESQSEVLAQSEQLHELNQEQDHMIDILAHDLKSPLNAITGLMNIVNFEKDNLSATQKECLEQIDNSVEKSKELVTKVMQIGAVEQRKVKLDMQPVDVSKLLAEATKRYEILASNKGMSIKLTVPQAGHRISVDHTYFEQIINNLISNAIKFSPKGSVVEVISTSDNGKVNIEVKDQGPGIKEEEKHLLFGKFSRLSNLPTGGEGSSGLGLSLVKRYVEMMDGEVWCESVPGKGASFITSFNLIEK